MWMTVTVATLVTQRDNVLEVPRAPLRFQVRLTQREREELKAVLGSLTPTVARDVQARLWPFAWTD
jgi:hypothetical protein